MPRIKIKILLPIVALILVVTYWHTLEIKKQYHAFVPPSVVAPQEKPVIGGGKVADNHLFWNQVFGLIKNTAPATEGELDKVVQFNREDKGYSKSSLASRFIISEANIEGFRKSHHSFVDKMPKKLSESVYEPNTRGVVLIGGGRFSWLSYLALTNLRELGSTLPVEFIIPSFNDFEKEREFCTKVLPQHNARCVLVPDVLGHEVMNSWEFKNYQYKPLALAVSSFQQVLLLDSDNFVLENPDSMLESDLFQKNGLVTWPDYWRRQLGPQFYKITGVTVNEKKRVRYNRLPLKHDAKATANLDEEGQKTVPYHEMEGSLPDLSTESGQLYIDKATHGRTLMLSLYYNLWGPKLWYRIFSSGNQGEGDKDTFLAAAHVVKEPYYQLKTFIKTMGYLDDSGQFQGVAMGQADPFEDYEKFKGVEKHPIEPTQGETINSDPLVMGDEVLEQKFGGHLKKKLFAVHCNWPKFDPLDLMKKPEIYDSEKNKLKYRFYGDLTYKKPTVINGAPTTKDVLFEVERWREIKMILCENRIKFAHFKEGDIEVVCDLAKNQLEWLENEEIKN